MKTECMTKQSIIVDYWAIEKSISEFDDSKGVLLVLIINDFAEMNLNWKKRENKKMNTTLLIMAAGIGKWYGDSVQCMGIAMMKTCVI